jgi:hypothetical protein
MLQVSPGCAGEVSLASDAGYIAKFTASGTLNVLDTSNGVDVNYLIVGGGGGGGKAQGGGGGAGGYRSSGFGPSRLQAASEKIGTGKYTVTIGAGGAGSTSSNSSGTSGSNSSFIGIVSAGGGGGGSEGPGSSPARS